MLKANCTKVQFAFSLHLKKLNIREGILRADGSIVDRRRKSCVQSCYMSWLVYAVVYLGANTAVCWSSRWLLRSDCHSVFNMHARWLDIHRILSLWQLRPSSRGTTCWSDNICPGCDWLVLSWLCAGELKWISSQLNMQHWCRMTCCIGPTATVADTLRMSFLYSVAASKEYLTKRHVIFIYPVCKFSITSAILFSFKLANISRSYEVQVVLWLLLLPLTYYCPLSRTN